MSDSDQNLLEDTPDNANLIYILYLASLLLGVTAIIGLIMAYIYKGDAKPWLQTHYIYMIHTFWKGLLYGLISMLLTVVLIGFLLLLLLFVWWIVRCVKGMKLANKREAVPDPRTWLF